METFRNTETETAAYILIFVAISALTIYSNKGLSKKPVQIAVTIITAAGTAIGTIYYYFSDIVVPTRIAIILSLCLFIFFIVFCIIEKIRIKQSVMLVSIFINLLTICVILLTKQ